MKYLKRITIFTAIALIPSVGVAIDTATSGRIIDRFKEQQKDILFESLPFSDSGANMILEQEYALNGLDGLKSRLSLVQTAYIAKRDEMTARKHTLQEALDVLDQVISQSEANIAISDLRIRQKDVKSQELSQMSIELSKKIYTYRQTILTYLSNIYSEGNMLLDDAGEVDIVKGLLLSDQDSDSSLTDLTYKSLVTLLGQKFVDEYRTLKKDYYLLSIQVREERDAIETMKKDLEQQKTLLESQRTERVRLLEITKGQEELYQKYIQSQEVALASVEDAWKVAQDRYERGLSTVLAEAGCNGKKTAALEKKCAEINTYFTNERALKKTEFPLGTANILTWPIESRRVTAFFRDAEYYHYVGSQHDAIDIATPQGSEVRAPAAGYVYYELRPTPGGYSYMALKHRDGYMTVYGHLSEILVAEGEFVQAGQLIAKSGGAVGTPGAGPMTSGPHLHFELWKNKEVVDPLRSLSMADINYDTIPSRYQDKFVSDLIEKSGTGTDLSKYQAKFVIRGGTEEERQKFLLKTYATSDFQSWDTWVDTSLDAGIDPSFTMCIGLAETTLGNHLKTPYNIGNVGNTDDGSVRSFVSPSAGISAMTSVFNNKYLGKYNKLSELSRWGNPNGAIYASSSSNWHNNIVRCLSALKGRFVEDDFEFRVKQ